MKFTQKGGVQITVSIVAKADPFYYDEETGGKTIVNYLEVSVEDTGVGIDKDDKKKLF